MMWLSTAKLAFIFTFAQIVSSKAVLPRQEQCNSAVNNAAYSACSMKAAFGGSSVIPELIPTISLEAALSVTYGDVVVGGAQQLSPAKVFDAPSLSLSFISNSSQAFTRPYVIVGLDYQAGNQSISFFWLQSALQIDHNTGMLSSSMAPIVPYRSPNPQSGTGTHEFILFVFIDTGLRAFFNQNPRLISVKSVSELKNFLAEAKLDNQLVAGSYFKSTYDGLEIDGETPAASKILQNQRNFEPLPPNPPHSLSKHDAGRTSQNDSDKNEVCPDEEEETS